MSLSLLQGHFYLLCTVMVIANLVHGEEGAIASLASVTRALHKVAILYIMAAYIIIGVGCEGHVTTHGGASSV